MPSLQRTANGTDMSKPSSSTLCGSTKAGVASRPVRSSTKVAGRTAAVTLHGFRGGEGGCRKSLGPDTSQLGNHCGVRQERPPMSLGAQVH